MSSSEDPEADSAAELAQDEAESQGNEPSRQGGRTDQYVIGQLSEDAIPVDTKDLDLRRAELDRERNLDRFRGLVTLGILACCVTLSTFLILFSVSLSDEDWRRVSDLIPIVVTPFYTLLAIAIGYYFGTQNRK